MFDEAHHLREIQFQKDFKDGYFKEIASKKTLFLTATPVNTKNLVMIPEKKDLQGDMGKMVYRYGFAKALKEK